MDNGESTEATVERGKDEKEAASKKFSSLPLGCGCLVLLLIALAGASVFPWGGGIMKKAREMTAKNDALQLKNAIATFFVEYRKYPEMPSSEGKDYATESGGTLMLVLMGEEDVVNPRQIPFFMARAAKSDGRGGFRNGAYFGKDGLKMFDPWGNLYHIAWDANFDDQIANPDPVSAKTMPFIPSGVLVWSAGPDGDPATWADNITSWGL